MSDHKGGTSLDYMPRLDGLRAIAVFGVLVEHFAPPSILTAVSPGGAGVSLFFVLSGYLITRILLNYRESCMPMSSAAMHFYWRRFLRLSPPYYLAIFLASAMGILGVNETWLTHSLYLTNFQIGISGRWTGGADHFWSLCTEEQFYLLWFLVIVVVPKRLLLPTIFAGFLVTFGFRIGVYLLKLPSLSTVLLPGNLCSLVIGALLAHSLTSEGLKCVPRLALSKKWLVGTGLVFAGLSISIPFVDLPRAIFYPFVASLFFACVVLSSANKRSDIWLDWLSWRPLIHMGKISYGIFVYHLFIPDLMRRSMLLSTLLDRGWIRFIVLCIVSIAVAHVSWVCMEQPLLRFKDKVPMPRALEPARSPLSGHN